MEVDIACAGFGPATGGFLTTLTQAWSQNPTDPAFESRVVPGMPLQVLCYERADDLAAGVSGVVTRAEGIRSSFPALDPAADSHGRRGKARARSLPARSHRRQPALRALAPWRFLPRSWERAVGERLMPSSCPGRPRSSTSTAA